LCTGTFEFNVLEDLQPLFHNGDLGLEAPMVDGVIEVISDVEEGIDDCSVPESGELSIELKLSAK
jgi:hypothetical protein